MRLKSLTENNYFKEDLAQQLDVPIEAITLETFKSISVGQNNTLDEYNRGQGCYAYADPATEILGRVHRVRVRVTDNGVYSHAIYLDIQKDHSNCGLMRVHYLEKSFKPGVDMQNTIIRLAAEYAKASLVIATLNHIGYTDRWVANGWEVGRAVRNRNSGNFIYVMYLRLGELHEEYYPQEFEDW